MNLVLLKEAARSGLFESEAALRAAKARNELVKDRHWFQKHPGGRIYIDLDAIVEDITRPAVRTAPSGRIPVARGRFLREAKEGSTGGMQRR